MADMNRSNRCTGCDSLVTQLEPYRKITEGEREEYQHLPVDARVSKVECPICGHKGLGVDWRVLDFFRLEVDVR